MVASEVTAGPVGGTEGPGHTPHGRAGTTTGARCLGALTSHSGTDMTRLLPAGQPCPHPASERAPPPVRVLPVLPSPSSAAFLPPRGGDLAGVAEKILRVQRERPSHLTPTNAPTSTSSRPPHPTLPHTNPCPSVSGPRQLSHSGLSLCNAPSLPLRVSVCSTTEPRHVSPYSHNTSPRSPGTSPVQGILNLARPAELLTSHAFFHPGTFSTSGHGFTTHLATQDAKHLESPLTVFVSQHIRSTDKS